jgi:hypothetical protein
MTKRIQARLTYANVVATLALFVALGGSSYAALRIGSAQIVNNSVRSKDVRNGDLRGRDVRDGSLTGLDLKSNSLSGTQIDEAGIDAATFTLGRAGPLGCTPGPDVSGPSANVIHEDAPLVGCGRVEVSTVRPARIFVVVNGEWYPAEVGGASYPTKGRCLVTLDGVELPATLVRPGIGSDADATPTRTLSFATSAMSEVVTVGSHALDLQCAQVQGDFRIARGAISALAVGAG